jgi:hypothetical protein
MPKGGDKGARTPTEPTTRFEVPLFVIVTVCLEITPSFMVPNGIRRSFAGGIESVIVIWGDVAVEPVPLTFMVADGVEGSLLGMLKESLYVPGEAGANLTEMVHEPEGRIVLPEQLSECMVNGDASGFVPATVPIVRLALPALLTVRVWSE